MAPVGYAELLEQVKVRVRTSRVQAARAVNTELVGLYWQIGRLILDRQESEGSGSKVIGRLAADLRAEFPGMRGVVAAEPGLHADLRRCVRGAKCAAHCRAIGLGDDTLVRPDQKAEPKPATVGGTPRRRSGARRLRGSHTPSR